MKTGRPPIPLETKFWSRVSKGLTPEDCWSWKGSFDKELSELENTVELVGWYGSDQTHALSAWCSTKREITEEREARIGSFLKQLAEQGHTSVFEKSYLHFLVTCDTASHIHFLKHRIGVSVNAESARYKELRDDKYYIPDDWPEDLQLEVRTWVQDDIAFYHELIAKLVSRGIDRKRAKESARFVLPYANQLTLDVGFNFRSFMHFQSLRNKPDAQKEIRDIAQKMLELVWETRDFDLSLRAFGYKR